MVAENPHDLRVSSYEESRSYRNKVIYVKVNPR